MRNRINQGIKVECRQIGIFSFDVHHIWSVIPGHVHKVRHVVIQVGKGDPVLGPHRLPNDDFVDVVELIPVLIPKNLFH